MHTKSDEKRVDYHNCLLHRFAGSKMALRSGKAKSTRLLPRDYSVFSSSARQYLMMKQNMNVMQGHPNPLEC